MLRAFAFALAAIVPLGLTAPAAADPQPTRAELEAIILETILDNPEVLEQAFAKLQEDRQREADEARVASIAQYRERLEASPTDGVIGNPDGDVTLVEFFDYNCGFCARALDDLYAILEEDKNLRVVLKEFPVLGQASMEAAAVSIGVSKNHPDAYEEFHRRVLSYRGAADGNVALSIAAEMGLPRDALAEGMRSDDVRQVVEEGYELAQALGLSGTPSYVIGDRVEFGAVGVDALKAAISQARCGADAC